MRLTKTICSLIRQQRHLGVRIIVSTQEPTVVPATILDLTSYIICHRFSSPSWCSHLKQHVSLHDGDGQLAPWVEEVMQLHTGEALIFSPNAVAVKAGLSSDTDNTVSRVGVGYFKILTRPRITLDGGFSITAVDPGRFHEQPDATRLPTTPSAAEQSLPTHDGDSAILPHDFDHAEGSSKVEIIGSRHPSPQHGPIPVPDFQQSPSTLVEIGIPECSKVRDCFAFVHIIGTDNPPSSHRGKKPQNIPPSR
jgi:hypothetical protein